MYILLIGTHKDAGNMIDLAQKLGNKENNIQFSYDEDPFRREKINLCDRLIVIDKNKISNKSWEDIRYAKGLDIHIEYASRIVVFEEKPHLPIVTLCGSMKFQHRMNKIAKKMTLEGNVVLTPCIMGFDPTKLTAAQHETLDQIHRQKIDMCDYVLIVNVGGYYGSNTKEEIEYARSIGKEVRFLEE